MQTSQTTTHKKERGHSESARESTRDIMVWDPLVRLTHWGLALAILTNGAFTDPDGELHELVGFIALGLVITRLAWGLVGSEKARFSAFFPNPVAAIRHLRAMARGHPGVHLSHNPLGALMVYNIWATVLMLSATGIMMDTRRFYGFEWVEEIHELAFGWLIFSVVLHVASVFLDSWRSGVPLIRAMIVGRKRIPPEKEIE